MKSDFEIRIAKKLKSLRAGEGLNQDQIAEKCGIDISTVVRYENNNVSMNFGTLSKFLDFYDYSIYSFFEEIIAKWHKENEKKNQSN